MIHILEMPRVREYDNGSVRVVAKNPLGEVECSTTLSVIPQEDWRSRLKQAPRCMYRLVVLNSNFPHCFVTDWLCSLVQKKKWIYYFHSISSKCCFTQLHYIPPTLFYPKTIHFPNLYAVKPPINTPPPSYKHPYPHHTPYVGVFFDVFG